MKTKDIETIGTAYVAANLPPAAAAGWRVLFASGSPWPRAAQAGRYPPYPLTVR